MSTTAAMTSWVGPFGPGFLGTVDEKSLVLDEYGFGYHGTRAAGTSQSGDRRQQMQQEDGQIAHGTILPRSRNTLV